jgi:HPr kinase/phosphorylase
MTISVGELYEFNRETLELSSRSGEVGFNNDVGELKTSTADLIGHLNLIHPGRIQVFGHEEIAYITRLSADRLKTQTNELVVHAKPPAIILAEGILAPQTLLAEAMHNHVAVLASPIPSARLIDGLRAYLSRALAPTTTRHGVLMDVLGMGVLIAGESGLGKSELALELISRGHGLVADDAVELSRVGPDALEGRCPAILQNMLEVRGLGLLNIKTIFGETAVRRRIRLRLIVKLVRRSTMEDEYERLPLQALTEKIMDVPVRQVVIPVAAGRNLAVLTEAAVRNTILQLRGIDSMNEFIAKQNQMILDQGNEPS